MKKNLLFLLVLSTQAFAAGPMFQSGQSLDSFSIESLPGTVDSSGATIDCDESPVGHLEESIKNITDIPKHDKFWMSQSTNGDVYIKVVKRRPSDAPKEYITPLGMTNKDALLASRDPLSDSVFTTSHDQGDVANRWGHSVIYRMPAEMIKGMGASQILTTVVGFLASLPKEYLYDLHPSASDIPITYSDKLGTKTSSFEVTVFGDTLYNHRPFEGKVQVFKGSAPFVTWKKRF